MACSFVVNGRWSFGGRLDARAGVLFVATTGTAMWVLQPAVIGLLERAGAPAVAAKLAAIGASVVANYASYRFVVWRPRLLTGDRVTSDLRPSGPSAAPWAARR